MKVLKDKDMPNNEEGWKKVLTPEQYQVLRGKGTERAGTGTLLHEHGNGMYHCAACGNEIFRSDAKFDSGSGWPSFDQAIPGSVDLDTDDSKGMHHTEVTCARCGSHLGHLFNDGITETGKRYCLNSVSLDFEKKEKPEK